MKKNRYKHDRPLKWWHIVLALLFLLLLSINDFSYGGMVGMMCWPGDDDPEGVPLDPLWDVTQDGTNGDNKDGDKSLYDLIDEEEQDYED